MDEETLRKEILEKVKQFASSRKKDQFIPGESKIPYAGRIYDEKELVNLVDSSLDFWLTAGRYATEFEKRFADFFGTKFCSLTNSGSSANLLALSALTSKNLDPRLETQDKVITAAAGFPTTVNPIFQNNLIPVFVDVELGTYNADLAQIEQAAENGARAIMLAHTLGNPFDLETVMKIAKKHDLFVIEDCCDAVGSRFDGKHIGTFGDLATCSFYPAHHITMGEGGAVLTSNPLIKRQVESFRDWGKDCWCPAGKENTCGKRFKMKMGELPFGYDHKYIYSNIGYNLKVTDMQAAIGLAQLDKLDDFIRKRKDNFAFFLEHMKEYEDAFILPKKHPKADPSPFGFPLTVQKDAPFTKNEIVEYLESKGISTRMLFGGNLTRQPAYLERRFEKIGKLPNSDFVMENTFWIGVYPGLTEEMKEYMVEQFSVFIKNRG